MFEDEDLKSPVKPAEEKEEIKENIKPEAQPAEEEKAADKKAADNDYLNAILGDNENYRVYLDNAEKGGDEQWEEVSAFLPKRDSETSGQTGSCQ